MGDGELPIPQEAIEAAAKVMSFDASLSQDEIDWMEEAIRAFCEAMGIKVERKTVAGEPLRVSRLVSAWRPVSKER